LDVDIGGAGIESFTVPNQPCFGNGI